MKEFCANNHIIVNLKMLGFFRQKSTVRNFRPNKISEYYQYQKKRRFRKKFCCNNCPNCWGFSIEIQVFHSRHLPWNSKISKIMTGFFFLPVTNIWKEPQLLVLFYPLYWRVFFCVLPQWRQPPLVLQCLSHTEKNCSEI